MSALPVWVLGLPAMLAAGLLAWVIASARRNVGLVDIFWSLFFLVAALTYASGVGHLGTRAVLVLALVTAWALRLAIYLALRNWSKPEDHRYLAIRARNEPGFAMKSLYLVFGLQVALAWIISLPLAAAITSKSAFGALDAAGLALSVFGIAYESVADIQLAAFKSRLANSGKVMDLGLWRYSRHPNYFGECCVWWGFYLIALSAGAWWCLFSPLLMTTLLLKVSGVALLEETIGERRPAYRDYIARTNAFLPGRVRQ
jgi:steroid 5-alpha reductase family enzyme